MNTNVKITLSNLSIGYRNKTGVKLIASGINESIYEGQLICVLGSNGGGKSTLLKTIAGYLKPLEGKIEINGKNFNRLNKEDKARFISVVLTTKPSIDSLSAFELVALGRTPYTGFLGKLDDANREIVKWSMKHTGTWEFKDRPIGSLSDGERQKLMIAKALAQDTPIILLDEPTAFLDYPSKVVVMELLAELCALHKKSIIITTHDLDIAMPLANHLWMIDKNIGFFSGTVQELSCHGVIQKFFNTPSLQFDMENLQFKIIKDHLQYR